MTKTWQSWGHSKVNRIKATLVMLLGACVFSQAQPDANSDSAVFGSFVGTSPCTEAIRPLLDIRSDVKADMIQWKLTLYRDPKTLAPVNYKLHCDYGPAVPNIPGLGKIRSTTEKEGQWIIAKGTKSNPDAMVYELSGGINFFRVDSNILHVLNRDRSLMIGNGGWSYTLNRAENAEKRAKVPTEPDRSYSISPLATGPTVFGVFEGRTPGRAICRALKIPEDVGGFKVKWRITFYQNTTTRAPTTYKIEGSLHRQRTREGNWSIVRDRDQVIYRLEPTKTEAALFLLKGDDNVLFFVDDNYQPLAGNAEFSYTLNRRDQ